jgi:hypothetical protein
LDAPRVLPPADQLSLKGRGDLGRYLKKNISDVSALPSGNGRKVKDFQAL